MRSTVINAASHGAKTVRLLLGVRPPPGTAPSLHATVATPRPVCSHERVEQASEKARDGGSAYALGASTSASRRRRVDELFKEHAACVARLAFRMVGRAEEVDDIVQDVFIALFRHLDTIRQSESVRPWLATTTVRMGRRRLRVRRIGFLLRGADRMDVAELKDNGASGEDRATLRNIHAALEQVSVNSKIAWILRCLEQESVDEVARLCGCSKSTAKRRIADAHNTVKRAVSDE